MKSDKPNRSGKLITGLGILVAATIINTLLARYVAVPLAGVPGIASLYPAVAFMIAFGLWFGWWGIIAAYLGCFVGAGMLNQMAFDINLYFSLADLWQVLIPVAAFKTFGADINLTTGRDWVVLIIFGWLLNNLVGAAWGSASLAVGGAISWSAFFNSFVRWFLGNLVVVIVLTPLLLKYLSPIVRRTRLPGDHGQADQGIG